jgi:hypothetical protein
MTDGTDDQRRKLAHPKSRVSQPFCHHTHRVRAALKGAPISPEFPFLNERLGKLDDFALAGRLSYLL